MTLVHQCNFVPGTLKTKACSKCNLHSGTVSDSVDKRKSSKDAEQDYEAEKEQQRASWRPDNGIRYS